MPSTLEDVARQAGVSMKTVSRVVNNEHYVADDTRRQVLRVIAEIGYVPHLQAQRLASGRTRSIALHYPLLDPSLISNEIEMNFITGIASGAAEHEYFFNLMTGEFTRGALLKLCRRARTGPGKSKAASSSKYNARQIQLNRDRSAESEVTLLRRFLDVFDGCQCLFGRQMFHDDSGIFAQAVHHFKEAVQVEHTLPGWRLRNVHHELGVGTYVLDVRRTGVACANDLPHLAHGMAVVPQHVKVADEVDWIEVGAHPRGIHRLDHLTDVLRRVQRSRDVTLERQRDAGIFSPRDYPTQAGDQTFAGSGRMVVRMRSVEEVGMM